MNEKQKRIVKLATLGLAGLQLFGLVMAINALRMIPRDYFAAADMAGSMMGAAIWPALVAGGAIYSLKLFNQDSHYGWMGLLTAAFLALPSLAFPCSVIIIYVLLSPLVRAPMLKKIDAEWGLS